MRLHPHPCTCTAHTQTCVCWDPCGPICTGCRLDEGWWTGWVAPLNAWGGKTPPCRGSNTWTIEKSVVHAGIWPCPRAQKYTSSCAHSRIHTSFVRSTQYLFLYFDIRIEIIKHWVRGYTHTDTNTPTSVQVHSKQTQTCVCWDPSTGCRREEGWRTGWLVPLNTWGGKTPPCRGTYTDHKEKKRFIQYNVWLVWRAIPYYLPVGDE